MRSQRMGANWVRIFLITDCNWGGAAVEFIEIEIRNWEKYNPRRDYKRPWWFALSNTITTDDIFSEFSDAEFRAWVHILCTASVQNTYRPKLFFKACETKAGIKRRTLIETIEKLRILQVIQIPAGICTESVRDLYCTLQNRTVQNTTNNNAHADAFAEFWNGYPRKVDKKKAEKAYLRLLAHGKDPAQILLARENYRDYLKANGTEKQFIRHPTTFLNSFEDYLDSDFGKSEDFSSKSNLDDLVLERPGVA